MGKIMRDTKKIGLLLALGLPVLLGCVDVMALGVGMHTLMTDLKLSLLQSQWIFTAYMLGNVAFLIAIGQFLDKFSKQQLLIGGFSLFLIASFLCGIAHSALLLILGRFFQGLGVAFLLTTSIALINLYYQGKERGFILGMWSCFVGLGIAIGPIVGGFIIHFLNWRMIFFINLPFSLPVYYLIYRFINKDLHSNKIQPFNFKTNLLFIGMLIAVIVLLNSAWHRSTGIIELVILVILLIALFLSHKKQPLLVLQLDEIHIDGLLVGGLAGFMAYFMLYSWLFILGIFLQQTFHYNAMQTAFYYLPYSILYAISSPIIGKYLKNITISRRLLIIGMSIAIIAFIVLMSFPVYLKNSLLITILSVLGVAIALIALTSIPISLHQASIEKIGTLSGIVYTFRWLGGMIGIFITSIIYHLFTTRALPLVLFHSSSLSNTSLGFMAVCLAQAFAASLSLIYIYRALSKLTDERLTDEKIAR